MSTLFEQIPVIDVDTHVSEPYDLWTSRVPRKWGDRVPHVVKAPGTNIDYWAIDDSLLLPAGITAMAGFDGMLPEFPETLAEAHPGAYDAQARLKYMDEEGIRAQVLYPNVGGFGSGRFLQLGEPELMLACVTAYNDFLTDWTRADPERLIAITALPFWDVDACLREIERCAARGHRGILFGSQPQTFGMPHLADRHWDPIWALAQEAGLAISFHIGSQEIANLEDLDEIATPVAGGYEGFGVRGGLAKQSVMLFMDNVHCITDVIIGGVCHRFPRLQFVSVESGAGWIPFAIEALDWQWQNNGVAREHPEYELLPSEYFRRQISGCFWFEEAGARAAVEQYPDSFLYETDFPHVTSMSPGPQSVAEHPRDYAQRVWSDLPEDTARKVFHDNAARIYGLS